MRLSTTEELPSIAACRNIEPRKLSRLMRGELDWIVMKALEKDRNRRYETANGLAADLRRYLDDEPVQACPPSAWYRFGKFARRNKLALTTTAVLLLAATLAAGSIGWSVRDRQTRQMALEREVAGALHEVEARFLADDQPEAMSALRRAEGLLGGAGGTESIRRQVQSWRSDLELVGRLEEIQFTTEEGQAGRARTVDDAYTRAFLEQGIEIDRMSVEQTAALIRPRRILQPLLRALDNWANVRLDLGLSDPSKMENSWRHRPEIIARAVDTDPYRNRIRLAVMRGDWAELDRLASDPGAGKLPYSSLRLLSREIFWGQVPRGKERAVVLLKEAQLREPSNYWLNRGLANYLGRLDRAAEQVGYVQTVLALRPKATGMYISLSNSFVKLKRFDEAINALREAVRLKPDFAIAHSDLGFCLSEKGQQDEAITECREAIRLKPDDANAHNNLGNALYRKGQLDAAILEYREAIRLEPDYAYAHNNLGNALSMQDKMDEAITELRRAIRLKPNFPGACENLVTLMGKQRKLDTAIAEFRRVIERNPKDLSAWTWRARAYIQADRFTEARADLERALTLDPDDLALNNDLAWLLANDPRVGDRNPRRAVRLATRAAELRPTAGNHWNTLGAAYYRVGDWKGAIEALTKSMELGRGGDASDWFFLAMAHWQLGDKTQARFWFDKAVPWMAKNQPKNGELIRFRDEAGALLGVNSKR